MFDAGLNGKNLLNNLDALEVDTKDVQAIVLSHGHADHALGLTGLMQRLGSRNIPLILHPDAYLERKLILPNGDETFIPPPRKSDLEREHIQVIEEVGPSMLVDGMILVSGEVARTTSFEKGFAVHYAKHDHGWSPIRSFMTINVPLSTCVEKGWSSSLAAAILVSSTSFVMHKR